MLVRGGQLHDFPRPATARSRHARRRRVAIDAEARNDARGQARRRTWPMVRCADAIREINFDGIVGPSHNYAGLSLGNLASARNAGDVSYPRAAALQGLAKMRSNLALGLVQGLFVPLPRPATALARRAGHDIERGRTGDRRQCHERIGDVGGQCSDRQPRAGHRRRPLPPHRRQSEDDAAPQPRMARHAGATATGVRGATHLRSMPRFRAHSATRARPITCDWRRDHGEPGVEIFVYGVGGGPFPARQHVEASKAVARLHRLDPERTFFAAQSEEAIAAGAFHNDVVAVANERVLFAHEQAFADKAAIVELVRGAGGRFRLCRGARDRGSAGRSDPLLSVQRAAGDAARRSDDAGRADRVPRYP